jgi:hypothetical protein
VTVVAGAVLVFVAAADSELEGVLRAQAAKRRVNLNRREAVLDVAQPPSLYI